MSAAPIAGVANLTVSVGGEDIVADATVALATGRVHGLIGGSGAGKSTIGRAIAGLRPTGALITGEIVGEGSAGYVPQSPASSFTPVRRLGPQVAEVLRANGGDGRDVVKLLDRVHLPPGTARMFPHQLSGGMAQRAAIAAALATGRRVLIADEPTSALDPELTGEVLKVIKSLKDLHIAMVIVTHEMAFARDISDKVIFMADGVIVEEGTPEHVFNSENERMQSFLGRYKNIL